MSETLIRAFTNLPKFFGYRGITPDSFPTQDEFAKEIASRETRYCRIKAKYNEDKKPVHIILISKKSTVLNDNNALRRILDQSGTTDILVFYEGGGPIKTGKNYQQKYPDRDISFYPIGILVVVHPEIGYAPKYSVADAKQVEEELKMPISSLRSTISKNDPPMVWYNWPVGSIVRIVSHSDYTGTRVRYRKLMG